MQSRLVKQVSPTTIRYYKVKLGRSISEINYPKARQHQIERFLLQFNNPGNRHGYYQAIKTFYIWLEQMYGLPNPIKHLPAPKVGKLILPSLDEEQVRLLMDTVDNARDKAIIALLTESGLRLTELTNLKKNDIDWHNRLVTKYWVRAEKRRTLHLVSSQSNIYRIGCLTTIPMAGISGG